MIYLLCGVPGAGKTWCIERLGDKFIHIPHDSYTHDKIVRLACEYQDHQYVIIDCPFDERRLRAQLERRALSVTPVFILERPSVIEARYFQREKKMPSANVLTRAVTIKKKIEEWGAVYGTSEEMLDYLRTV